MDTGIAPSKQFRNTLHSSTKKIKNEYLKWLNMYNKEKEENRLPTQKEQT